MIKSSINRRSAPLKSVEFVSICDEHFGRISHYSDRKTIWIKLYLDLLDDIDFCLLSDEKKFHFVGLMMLAARLNNRLPNNPQFLMQKLSATSQIDVEFFLEKRMLIPFKLLKRQSKSDSRKSSNGYQDAFIDKDKDKDKDKEDTDNKTAIADKKLCVSDSSKSNFSMSEINQYVLACQNAGQDIRNPVGLATTLFQNGNAENELTEFFQTGKIPTVGKKQSRWEKLRETAERVKANT